MSSMYIYNLYHLHQNSFDRHCDYHVVQPSIRMEAALAGNSGYVAAVSSLCLSFEFQESISGCQA